MNVFWRRIISRPGVFMALLAATLVISVLGLAAPLFVIQVLNRYITHGVDTTLAALVTGALIAVVLEFGFRQARLRLADVLAVVPDEAASVNNFKVATRSKLANFEAIPQGVRRQFLAGIDTLQQAYSSPNVATLFDFPFAAFYLGVIYLLSPPLALIASGFVVFMLVVGFLGTSGLARATQKVFEERAAGMAHVNTVLGAGDTVRMFNAAQFLNHAWHGHARRAIALARRLEFGRGLVQSVSMSAAAAMSIAVVAFGAVLVVRQDLDVGALIGANILASRALSSVSRFALLGETMAKANQAMGLIRYFHKLPQELESGAALSDFHGRIELSDIGFVHPGGTGPLFEHLNLTLETGTVLLIKGDNGSGKTTFCRLIAGLLEPVRGEILVDGVDLRQIVPEWWHKQVCYMPQEPTFLNASLSDNLTTINPDMTDEAMNRAAELADLKDFINQSPDGFNMAVVDNGRTLSLGVRKRMALARAIAGDGRCVIFDEPTEGLDEKGCRHVYDVLNGLLREGRTIIVSSHDPRIRRAATMVLDLDRKPTPVVYAVTGNDEGNPPEQASTAVAEDAQ